MEKKKEWLTQLKKEFSPLTSNVAFSLILLVLEKLVELEFQCPCNPLWNGIFSSAFFVIPAIMAFTLMMITQGFRCQCKCNWAVVVVKSLISSMVWLILLFLDGQYFVCAMTDWRGRFVTADRAPPQKWCEPMDGDEQMKFMVRSQELYVVSQVIGIAILIVICVGLIIYMIQKSCKPLDEIQDNSVEMTTTS